MVWRDLKSTSAKWFKFQVQYTRSYPSVITGISFDIMHDEMMEH